MLKNIDYRAIEISINRLKREIKLKKNIVPGWYLQGYHEAICNFVWDYTGEPLMSLDWDDYMQEQIKKGNIKLGVIPIKVIKGVGNEKNKKSN